MYKFSWIILSAWLFLGCGGGGSDEPISENSYTQYENRPDMPISTTVETSNVQTTLPAASSSNIASLRTLGYQNPENVYLLNDNKIAFTDNQNGNSEFCIYDAQQNQIISRISNFQGGQLIQVSGNNLYFINNIYIDASNPWDAKLQTDTAAPTYHDTVVSNPLQELKNRYGDALLSANYTYAKGGIFAEIMNNYKIQLRLFDTKTLKDEKQILYTYGTQLELVRGLKGGLVYIVTDMGTEIVYDYLNDKKVSETGGSTVSDHDLIKNRLVSFYENEKPGNWSFYEFKKIIPLAQNKYAVMSDVATVADDWDSLTIVDLSNKNDIKVKELKFANRFRGAFLEILRTDNSTVSYRDGMLGAEYYNIVYNYIGMYQSSEQYVESSSSISTNSNSVTTQISNNLENLITYVYSSQGGGIFAIGKKNGQYAFYRFNANPIALEQSFYNIGINSNVSIQSIEALSGARFRVSTSNGFYIFNYLNGSFE